MKLFSKAQNSVGVNFEHQNRGLQVGISNSPISTEFHLPTGTSEEAEDKLARAKSPFIERPETPPNPSSNLPFPRNIDFVDPKRLNERIREKCSRPESRVALVGLGLLAARFDTLTTMNNLAHTLKEQCKHRWALVLLMDKCVLGAKHPDTLNSLASWNSWQSDQRAVAL